MFGAVGARGTTMAEFLNGELDRRRFNGLLAGGAIAAMLGSDRLSGGAEPAADQKVREGVLQVGLRGRGTSIHKRQELDGGTFVVAGVTWARGGPTPAEVHLRSRVGGRWERWTVLGTDPDEPDGDLTDTRAGTVPLVAPGSDAIEVRVRPAPGGGFPEDLRLEIVGEEALPADASAVEIETAAFDAPATTAFTADASSVTAAASRPTILTRSEWGADETLRRNYGEDIQYGRVLGAFVHHTAGSNSYASADVPGIIRGIYRYHVVSRNFYDIGYNILVDRFGRLWEGAYGGLDKAVVAAHTQYYNSSAFGISALGTYTSKTVESALMTALGNAIAWKFSVHGIREATGTAPYSGSNASPKPRISGHRDAKSTACPGDSLYRKLPELRTAVNNRLLTGSTLSVDAPKTVGYGARTTLEVSWIAATGERLTGRVNLQRLNRGRWEHVRQFGVTDGRGSTVITPGSTNSYRLRAASCTRGDIDLSHPRGTSNTVEIKVYTGSVPALRLSGPSSVPYGARTTLTAMWLSPEGQPVTGRVNLQRRKGTGWEHVRQLDVVRGEGATTITPGASNSYRLRASSVSSPLGVPTSHPQGTSNTHSVTVV